MGGGGGNIFYNFCCIVSCVNIGNIYMQRSGVMYCHQYNLCQLLK